MKMNHVIIAVIVAGIIAAAMIFIPQKTDYVSAIECKQLFSMSESLDQLSYELDRLSKGIHEGWAVNAEQMARWKEDFVERRRLYNQMATEYNQRRKGSGCEGLPDEYFLLQK